MRLLQRTHRASIRGPAAAFILLLTAVPLCSAADARAAAGGGAGEAPSSQWYGWKVLAVDAAFWALLASGDYMPKELDPLWGAGVLVTVTSPPFVHVAEERYWTALQSAGLRLLVPPIAGSVMVSTRKSGNTRNAESDGDTLATMRDMLVGSFFGYLGAQLLDATVLSWRPADGPATSSVEYRLWCSGWHRSTTVWLGASY